MVNWLTWLTPELTSPWCILFGLWYSSLHIHRALTEVVLGQSLADIEETHPIWCHHFISPKSACKGNLHTEPQLTPVKFRVFISHFHRTPFRRSHLGMNYQLEMCGSVPAAQCFRKEMYCYLEKYYLTRNTQHQWIFSDSQNLYWFLTRLTHIIRKFTFPCCSSVQCCQQCCQHQPCCSSQLQSTFLFSSIISFFVHFWPNNIDNNPF